MPSDSDTLDETLQAAFRYACALAHQECEARDLLQEACLRVIGARRGLDRPYLFAAVRSSFVDSRRKDGRQVATNGSPPAALSNVSSPRAGDAVCAMSERASLADALGQLRPEEREALFLTIGLGQSAAQAARACGKSRGTILSLVQRAKRKLREVLNPESSEVTR